MHWLARVCGAIAMLFNHSHNLTVQVDEGAILASNGKTFAVATGETVGSAEVARAVPLLFVNVMADVPGGKDWARISRVDLTSGTTMTVLAPADLSHLTLLTGATAHV